METFKHSTGSYTVSGSKAGLPVQVAVNSLLTVSALRGIPGCYDRPPWVAHGTHRPHVTPCKGVLSRLQTLFCKHSWKELYYYLNNIRSLPPPWTHSNPWSKDGLTVWWGRASLLSGARGSAAWCGYLVRCLWILLRMRHTPVIPWDSKMHYVPLNPTSLGRPCCPILSPSSSFLSFRKHIFPSSPGASHYMSLYGPLHIRILNCSNMLVAEYMLIACHWVNETISPFLLQKKKSLKKII